MRKTIGSIAMAANLSSSSPATENVERLPGNAAEHAD